MTTNFNEFQDTILRITSDGLFLFDMVEISRFIHSSRRVAKMAVAFAQNQNGGYNVYYTNYNQCVQTDMYDTYAEAFERFSILTTIC